MVVGKCHGGRRPADMFALFGGLFSQYLRPSSRCRPFCSCSLKWLAFIFMPSANTLPVWARLLIFWRPLCRMSHSLLLGSTSYPPPCGIATCRWSWLKNLKHIQEALGAVVIHCHYGAGLFFCRSLVRFGHL